MLALKGFPTRCFRMHNNISNVLLREHQVITLPSSLITDVLFAMFNISSCSADPETMKTLCSCLLWFRYTYLLVRRLTYQQS